MNLFLSFFLILISSQILWSKEFKFLPINTSSEYFRSAFPSATAEVLSAIGAVKSSEKVSSQKVLAGSLASMMDHCFCDRPGKPRGWRIKQGLDAFAGARGLKIKVSEKCKVSGNKDEVLTFEEYQKWIDRKIPVIVSFTTNPVASENLQRASERTSGFAAIGVGYYVDDDGQKYIIAKDWEKERIPDSTLNPIPDGPWEKDGVVFYKWDAPTSSAGTPWTNLVFTFVEKADDKVEPVKSAGENKDKIKRQSR